MDKPKKAKPVNLSLSSEARERLEAAAKFYGATMTAIVEDLILNDETGLKDHKEDDQ